MVTVSVAPRRNASAAARQLARFIGPRRAGGFTGIFGGARGGTSSAIASRPGRVAGRRDNPLTARVFVNRLWKLFFGAGLSRRLDDLGAQGEPPTHPELLDWLAAEFIESGWDVKHMVRLVVTSRAYRQTSVRMRNVAARSAESAVCAAISLAAGSRVCS